MTEREWAKCPDSRDLLYLAIDRFEKWSGTRTPRLLACAACRLDWHHMTDPRSRTAIEVAERYCDGEATLKALNDAHRAATAAYREALGTPAHHAAWAVSKATRPRNPSGAMLEALTIVTGRDNPWNDEVLAMIRDAYGPRLFRRVAFKPSWRTSDTVGLARGIYHDRAFDRMPVLADALTDAGCEVEQVTDHCRSAGPHIRGCWVLDLALDNQ